MKMTFKIILIITIIFFSNESSDGVCKKDSDCFDFDKEDKCEDVAGGMGFCSCMEGYERNYTLKKCVKYVDFNETCDDNHDLCEGDNQQCYNNICSCKSGFIYNSETKKCEKILNYGDDCSSDGICDTKQKCGSDSKCTCVDGYEYNENEKICQKTVNYEESCDDNYDICRENLVCNAQKRLFK